MTTSPPEPYSISDHRVDLPGQLDMPIGSHVGLHNLSVVISAMRDRDMVVLIHMVDDEGGKRFTFSTHPDTITLDGAR